MRLLTIFILLIAISSKKAYCQECPCNKALETDTRNEFQKQYSKDFKQATSTLFTHEYEFWETYSSYQNKTTDLDAGFAIFSSSFSDNLTREEKKAKFEKMKQYYQTNNNIEQRDYEFIAQKFAAEIVYNAWVRCLEISCNNQDRMVMSYVISGNEINVTLKWLAKTNDRYTWVNAVLPINAQYVSGNLYDAQRLRSQNVLTSTFRRTNPHQDVVINVDVNGYDVTPIVISGLEAENPSSGMPVGIIIASVLDYATFCKLNNEPLVLNLKKSKWAPCDGRSVSGSDYGVYQANVPDLRGVFLRGLNDFGVKGVDVVSANQKDPDGDGRPANNLQQDGIQEHTHNYSKYISHGWKTDYGDKQGLVIPGDFETKPSGGTNEKTEGSTGKETRPKNKTVYYYIKINK